MSSIEQKLSKFPARNGFKTVYKMEGERMQVKQIRDDVGTLDSFASKGWKEYIRAAQPIEAKQFQPRETAADQIAELRRMQAELKNMQSADEQTPEPEEIDEPKRRGRKPNK